MSVLLDAFAVVALFRGERAAGRVLDLLEEGDTWTTSVNLAEIVDKMTRVFGAQPDDLEAELTMMGLRVEPVGTTTGLHAGRIRARKYDAQRCPVSLADCVAAAAATGAGARLATADDHLATVASDIGVEVVRLPRSRGGR